MWNLISSWVAARPARKRKLAARAIIIEDLELRQLLSATTGIESGAIAEIQTLHHGKAVPRIDGVAGEYTFSGEPGTLTITQQGLGIHGVITEDHNPSGDFDAQFHSSRAKLAKGTGTFFFSDDQSTSNVKVKIKFFPDGQGGFNFSYHYKTIR